MFLLSGSRWITSTSLEDVLGAKLNPDHWFNDIGYKLRALPVIKARSVDGDTPSKDLKVRKTRKKVV